MDTVISQSELSGRALTALVFRDSQGEQAVITSIVCRPDSEAEGLVFSGPGAFEKKAREHLLAVVWPAAQTVFKTLGAPQTGFTISLVNLGAASCDDRGMSVSGFSADTSVFLALLSAGLGLPVEPGLLSTGHIASPDGDIRMVKSLPAKLTAALAQGDVRIFAYPNLNHDLSLQLISPEERQAAEAAIIKIKSSIQPEAMSDIGDLVRLAFSEESVVEAGLRRGYFGIQMPLGATSSPVAAVLRHLGQDLEERFWSVLERIFLDGEGKAAQRILTALICHHLQLANYPASVGQKLLRLLMSLPPAILGRRLIFPLVPLSDCIRLSQLAVDTDPDDVPLLFKAIQGDILRHKAASYDSSEAPKPPLEAGDNTLSMILAEIDPVNMAARVTHPIDEARGSYDPGSVLVQSPQEFEKVITAFWIHLMRHINRLTGIIDQGNAAAEAFDLVKKAFARDGEMAGAYAEALYGVKGGLRWVLDRMTEQMKFEERQKHINRVFLEALDPLDWETKTALMGALLKRLGPCLPPEIASQPAERFASKYESLIKAYAESADQVNSLLRTT